jgi:catechol 2,3-dioxygenase-like lactoylglutathione lyase family enzyme
MGIKGIDHWVIVAGDPERTLGFYARLGFTIAWEHREDRPRMPTIRINDAQKINVHGPDWPERPGYLGARRPAVGGADFCLEWEGTVQEVLDLLRDNGITPEAGPARGHARAPPACTSDPHTGGSPCTITARRAGRHNGVGVAGGGAVGWGVT